MLEHMEWWEELFENPLVVENGQIVMSENPGIGLVLAERMLTKFTV